MAHPDTIPFPRSSEARFDADLAQVQTAIDLVAEGVAKRVFLTGLVDPEAAASMGVGLARRVGVAFAVERGIAGHREIRVGPRLTR